MMTDSASEFLEKRSDMLVETSVGALRTLRLDKSGGGLTLLTFFKTVGAKVPRSYSDKLLFLCSHGPTE